MKIAKKWCHLPHIYTNIGGKAATIIIQIVLTLCTLVYRQRQQSKLARTCHFHLHLHYINQVAALNQV